MSLSQVTVTRRSLIMLHIQLIWAQLCTSREFLDVLFAAFSHFIIQTQWHHVANEVQSKADAKEVCLMNYSFTYTVFSLKRSHLFPFNKGNILFLSYGPREPTYQKAENKNVICNIRMIEHLELKYGFTSYSEMIFILILRHYNCVKSNIDIIACVVLHSTLNCRVVRHYKLKGINHVHI